VQVLSRSSETEKAQEQRLNCQLIDPGVSEPGSNYGVDLAQRKPA
jgi:hypothetical protein